MASYSLRTQHPPVTFDRANVRATLEQFTDQTAPTPLTPNNTSLLVKRYRRYYGLNFEEQLTNVTAYCGVLKTAGFDIVCHYYASADNAQGTLFVIHGLYDHVGIYNKIIEFYLRQGFNIVTFDLPGHGLSSGHNAVIKDFEHYHIVLTRVVAYFNDHAVQPFKAVGQSTGGAILIDWLLRHRSKPYPFIKTLLLAPLVRPHDWESNRRIHSVLSPLLRFIPRKFTQNSGDPDFLTFLKYRDDLQPRYLSVDWVGALKKWVPLIEQTAPLVDDANDNEAIGSHSVMAIQGEQDETVDWRYNIPFLQQKLPHMQAIYFPTMRHQVVNEAKVLRDEVFYKGLGFLEGGSMKKLISSTSIGTMFASGE